MIDDISIRYCDGFSGESLRSPVLIEGLPGIGQVGKLVTEYMIHMMGAEKIGEIHSIYFPPHVVIEESGIARLTRNELFLHRGEYRDILFLTGDYQSTSNEGHYLLTDAYLDIAADLKVERIYTLGGFGVGHLVEEPRVFGAVNNPAICDGIESAGAITRREEPGGGIVGAAGLMLGIGALRGQDAVCLMGETSGYIVDPRSAAAVLSVLSVLLGISVDATQLNDRAVEMEKAIEGLIENERMQKDEELSYIG